MLTLRSIVCPVDFSDQSRDALRWAVALAAQYASRLTVLNAVEPLLAEAARVRLRLDLTKAETAPALREFVETVLPANAAWSPQTNLDVRAGEPAAVILDRAAQEHADLVVMGTHGLGGFRKLVLGSTTERVLRHASTALLVVPHQDRPVITLASDGPRFNLTRILAATDFSRASAEASRWAHDLAQRLAIPLVLTHVVVPVTVPAQWQSYVSEGDEERGRAARAHLDALSRELGTGVHHEVVVPVGRSAESIASLARERDAGLIAVGLMDERAAHAPRPGSIAYRVVCLAHVPVLVVPAHIGGSPQFSV